MVLQVSVAPGGRWSRFKTYSTIQRTLEIWGFVLTFIFKAWLNSQKFSYRGKWFLVDWFWLSGKKFNLNFESSSCSFCILLLLYLYFRSDLCDWSSQ
jgi:hypothetical protein